MVDGTTTTYVYDYANRLTALGAGGATATCGCDAFGQRVIKTAPRRPHSIRSNFTLSLVRWAQALHTQSIAEQVIVNHGWTTNIQQTLDYYPYGATRINSGSDVSARKYIGQFADPTGLSYFNARYLASDRGQFISQDPVFLADPKQQTLTDPQSLNSYSYSNDNPITRSDPSGLFAMDAYMSGLANGLSSQAQGIGHFFTTSPVTSGTALGESIKGILNNPAIITQAISAKLTAFANASDSDQSRMMGQFGSAAIFTSLLRNPESTPAAITQDLPAALEGGQGFATFEEAKATIDVPAGFDLHHIVEQNPMNKSQFPPEWLHNSLNLIPVPRDIHQDVTALYNTSVGLDTSGSRLRDLISGMSFDEQHQIGLETLQQVSNDQH